MEVEERARGRGLREDLHLKTFILVTIGCQGHDANDENDDGDDKISADGDISIDADKTTSVS